jgi:hypothetical protein
VDLIILFFPLNFKEGNDFSTIHSPEFYCLIPISFCGSYYYISFT